MEPIQEIKAEHGANTAVILTNWMDTQDQIRSKGLEPGPYADRLEPEQRLSRPWPSRIRRSRRLR
jgi:hypothetical protein